MVTSLTKNKKIVITAAEKYKEFKTTKDVFCSYTQDLFLNQFPNFTMLSGDTCFPLGFMFQCVYVCAFIQCPFTIHVQVFGVAKHKI